MSPEADEARLDERVRVEGGRNARTLGDVQRLLGAFEPCSALEAEHLAAMRSLVEGPENALARGSFSPGHFTASAFVVSEARGALLLHLHAKLGLWLQPGGHFEPEDASLLDAVRRELTEETGIEDALVSAELFALDVHEIPAIGAEPAHRHHDLRVLFSAPREVHPSLEQVSGLGRAELIALGPVWVPLASIADEQRFFLPHGDTDQSVRRIARRLLARR